jgi:hypothetical protein
MCYPALALMVAGYCDRLWRRVQRPEPTEKRMLALCAVIGGLLALIFALLPLLLAAHTRKFQAAVPGGIYPVSWALSSVLAFGTVAFVLVWLAGQRDRAFWLMVIVPWVFGLLVARPTWALVNSYSEDPVRRLAAASQRYVPPGRTLVVVHLVPASAVYYSRRHVDFTWPLAHGLAGEVVPQSPYSPAQARAREREIVRERFASGHAAAALVRDDMWGYVTGIRPWRVVGRDGPFLLIIPAAESPPQATPRPAGPTVPGRARAALAAASSARAASAR